MRQHSALSTSSRSEEVDEKTAREGGHHQGHDAHQPSSVDDEELSADAEKAGDGGGLRKINTKNSNIQAVPGVPLYEAEFDARGSEASRAPDGQDEDDDDDESGSEQDEAARRAGGLAGVLGRAVSRTSTKSSWNPGPPPDGGWNAWSNVFAAHFVIVCTWGYINSFGVFQTYYSTSLSLPPSTISWIGSVQVFLLFFIGTFTGRLTDAGFFRPVFLFGSVIQMVGIFTTSVCTTYWQFFLAQGVCMGVGNGCLFCPTLATVSTYFSTRRGLAIGMAACGSATGGLVFPAMARQLLASVGFGWTIRAIGFVQLVLLGVANLVLRTRIPPRKSGALVEWAAFREFEYTFYAAGSFTCFLGVYFAFYYLASFSRDIIGLSYTDSLNLLLLLNGIGVIGRLAPNYLADRFGAINMFIPTALIAGVCQLSWIAVADAPGLYAWAVFYGIASGGIQSLFPAGLSSLTTDLRKAGTRMGMVFTINSFATLTGPPIAGALITRAGGSYVAAQAFAGGCLLLGTGFMVAARLVRTRRIGGGWRVKV